MTALCAFEGPFVMTALCAFEGPFSGHELCFDLSLLLATILVCSTSDARICYTCISWLHADRNVAYIVVSTKYRTGLQASLIHFTPSDPASQKSI